MNSMKLVIPLHFISWKKTPNDAVTPQRQNQFTPKTKANAVSRLLSSLVWIDQYNECNVMIRIMEFTTRCALCKICLINATDGLIYNSWHLVVSFPENCVIGHLCLMIFWCLLVSEEPNNAMTSQKSTVISALLTRTMSTVKLCGIPVLFLAFWRPSNVISWDLGAIFSLRSTAKRYLVCSCKYMYRWS